LPILHRALEQVVGFLLRRTEAAALIGLNTAKHEYSRLSFLQGKRRADAALIRRERDRRGKRQAEFGGMKGRSMRRNPGLMRRPRVIEGRMATQVKLHAPARHFYPAN
jgi:hypothetical protein